MDDVLRDLGLEYAQSLPAAIASVLVPLVLIASVMCKVAMANLGDWRIPILVGLCVAALGFVVQLPTAIEEAEAYCRSIYPEGKTYDGFTLPYQSTRCARVWPGGPPR